MPATDHARPAVPFAVATAAIMVFTTMDAVVKAMPSDLATMQVVAMRFVLGIPLVLLARFISVGLPLLVLKPWLNCVTHTVKILTWGGLRGGISIALALSLPEFEGKSLFVVATYAVVLFSLIVQAPTLNRLLRKWNPQ